MCVHLTLNNNYSFAISYQ